MQEQVSDALVRVKSILSDVKKSVQSVPSPVKLLPQISDILSEISEVVSSVHQSPPTDAMDETLDDDLWWDSSAELVNYNDSDKEESMMSSILFSSDNLGSLTSLTSHTDDQTKDFISRILSCVSKAAPGDVFSRRKYERKRDRLMRSLVHPELFSLWQHSSQLHEDYKVDYVKPAPLYPVINLRDVNVRALANIPKPTHYPVYGCSMDPAHYKNTGHGPFGWIYGYVTIHGIVPVPDHPIHGYIWDHVKGDWILYSDVATKDPARGRFTTRNQMG